MLASLRKLLQVPVKEKDDAKAKHFESVRVTKEVLVMAKANVAAQVGIAYDLYRKLLTGDPEAHWDQIVSDMQTKNPWTDLVGVKHKGNHLMTQESLKVCIEFHKLTVFSVDAVERLKYYLMCHIKKPVL
jgi:hypothetical protein